MILQFLFSRGRRILLALIAASAFVAFALNLRLFFSREQTPGTDDPDWAQGGINFVPIESPSRLPALATPTPDSLGVVAITTSQSKPVPTPASDPSNLDFAPSNTTQKANCEIYDRKSSLVIALKTGATEALARIPPSLLTFLQCPGDDLLLFSDMEQDIGPHHIYDSLDSVAMDVKVNNTEFDLYNDQIQARLKGEMIDTMGNRGPDAWHLDKYKNIHIAQKSWAMRPNRDWYFFIDADTYIFYSSLSAFLARFNPDDKLYFGSAVWVGQPPYGHGGSGYIVSRGAMLELVGPDAKELAEKSDRDTKTHCCGDEAMAKVLFWKGTNITNVRPVLQGDRLRTMRFGEKRWCGVTVTMHKVSPEEINDLWSWEMGRENPNDPVTLSTLLTSLPPLPHNRTNWHNGAYETHLFPPQNDPNFKFSWFKSFYDFRDRWTIRPWQSFESCKIECEKVEDCLSFLHWDVNCILSRTFAWGWEKGVEDNGKTVFRSGWMTGRIEAWKAGHKCVGMEWEPDHA